ncbi:snodprot1 [Cylindrobasidium torrendii FP15055 ss-10]|uniref:Snodprot1 n=1 Tax=Cylindrobasidium torrendii FP15055 ss-10 TaxID=1314674 RepID=A0A0D7BMJ3_9AGAR|nr:snodprot1 [Cylindrobasidium torrendii FP15055 ss-10]
MKLISIIALIFTTLSQLVFAVDQVGWDSIYGDGDASLAIVACSDGSNGLLTRGFKTFSDLPTFPAIGSAYVVGGWNSPACGTCWTLTYYHGNSAPKTVTFTAIDTSGGGFYTSQESLDYLTGGHAVEWGVVNVTATQVSPSQCGL